MVLLQNHARCGILLRKEKEMKVCVLGSGSKGNSVYIESSSAKILIDCGFSFKETTARLNEISVKPQDIDAILVTHEHSDHTKGLGAFSKACEKTLIFGHNSSMQHILRAQPNIKIKNLIDFFDGDFYFKDLTISPFDVPHDAEHCLGYSIYNNGKKISIATDLGHTTPEILNRLKNSSLVVLEANHDKNLLRASTKYPSILKHRIASNSGHLSNNDCGSAILDLAKTGEQQKIILAHLSEETNTKDTALQTISDILSKGGISVGKDAKLNVAEQNRRTDIFNID